MTKFRRLEDFVPRVDTVLVGGQTGPPLAFDGGSIMEPLAFALCVGARGAIDAASYGAVTGSVRGWDGRVLHSTADPANTTKDDADGYREDQ